MLSRDPNPVHSRTSTTIVSWGLKRDFYIFRQLRLVILPYSSTHAFQTTECASKRPHSVTRPSSKLTTPIPEQNVVYNRLPRSVYTGYLDVDAGAKHLFFYFFESRRDPDKGKCLMYAICTLKFLTWIADDVMMWINGGMNLVDGWPPLRTDTYDHQVQAVHPQWAS